MSSTTYAKADSLCVRNSSAHRVGATRCNDQDPTISKFDKIAIRMVISPPLAYDFDDVCIHYYYG
eukprot:4114721-Pleurochrysis_carterae.AAC.1